MNLTSFHSALDGAFRWALQNSLSATVLIALVLIVQIAFRRTLPPRWRYALGLLILLRLALPVAPASSLSIFNLAKRSEPPPVIRPMAQATVMPEAVPVPAITLAPGDYQTVANAAVLSQFEMEPVRPRINWGFLAELVWLTGCIALLVAAIWRHRRFARELRGWGAVAEPRALALLEECKTRLNVKRSVRLLSAEGLSTPALFGHWRPALLIPGEMLRRLGDRELRHIMLHELVHLKRGDILVNWAMILLRALHWFNPAVWFAFRRLRADQELACDADVMTLLDASERRDYGGTLIKVLEDFSASGLCPGLVPFVTRKPVIQRRITMIAQYKPAGRLVAAASFALMIALGCVTFTRAAGKQATASSISPSGTVEENPSMLPTPGVSVPAAPAQSGYSERSAALEKQFSMIDNQIRDGEKKVNDLRQMFGNPAALTEGGGESQLSETKSRLNALMASSDEEIIKTGTFLNELKKMNRGRLLATLPRLLPDPVLSSLVQDKMTAEIGLAAIKGTMGAEHPDVKQKERIIKDLDQEIDAQIDGIMTSLQTKLDVAQAQKERAQAMLQKGRTTELAEAREYRPYWEAKNELDRLKRLRDVLYLRAAQEQVEAQMPTLAQVTSNSQSLSKYAADVSPDRVAQYADNRKRLDSARSAYHDMLAKFPPGSPLIEAQRRDVEALERGIKALEELNPSLKAIPISDTTPAWPSDVLVINIQGDGSLRIDGSKGSLTADELTLAIKDGHPSAIEIRADSSAPFNTVVKVMDAARSGGVTSVSVHTNPSMK